ncbi:MAG: hypothetical protein WD749_15060 [Phycisphaerales bacterium]
MDLARAHRFIGAAALLTFLATGFYLRAGLPEPEGGGLVIHFAARANHIYILLAALLNGALGLYLSPRPRGRTQRAGSVLVLLAPVVLTAAFIAEHATASLWRPLTMAGIFCVALGMALHALSGRPGARGQAPRPV